MSGTQSVQEQQQQIPVLLLKEGTSETKGKDARKNNITAAKTVAEIVRKSFGPRGMDKMIVSPIGDVTITNDGATILKEIEIQHPAAKMMVEVAKSVDNDVGDGTTSAVVVAGALLEKAEELIAESVHPNMIAEGYKKASQKAIDILRDLAVKVDPEDKDFLSKIAKTSMASKIVSSNSQHLSSIVVDSVLSVSEKLSIGGSEKITVDTDNIKVEKKAGGSINDSKAIRGVALDKEVVHSGMPKKVENARIALLISPLEIEKTEMDAKLNINSPDQMQLFLDEENKMLKSMVDKISSAGATVVLCQKGIDDIVQHHLAKAGIMAVRRIKESDMSKLSKATGARIITNIEDLSGADLGSADLVEERAVETDKWVFVEGCKNPKAVTVLIRGSSQRMVDEAERSVHDAIMAVKAVVEYPYAIVGGGAPEAIVAQKIKEWSNSLSGRAQLAAEKFAYSIETLPLVLAENAGMDPLDTQVQLRTKATTAKPKYGIDVHGAKIEDLSVKDIYDPLAIKERVVTSATETACMILRIDNVISASKSTAPSGPTPGGAGGYGGGGAGDYD
jgi:archaeal chaperonin